MQSEQTSSKSSHPVDKSVDKSKEVNYQLLDITELEAEVKRLRSLLEVERGISRNLENISESLLRMLYGAK